MGTHAWVQGGIEDDQSRYDLAERGWAATDYVLAVDDLDDAAEVEELVHPTCMD